MAAARLLTLLLLFSSALAAPTGPSYVEQPLPSGSCGAKPRVHFDSTGAARCCNSGTWGSCSGMGGGSYTLPAATSTVLGGVRGTGSALVCGGTDKATGFDATGTLQCGADQDTIYTLPQATSSTLGGVTAPTCSAGNHYSGISAGVLTCSADAGGGSFSGNQYGVPYYDTTTSIASTAAPVDSASYLKSTVSGAPTWSKVSMSTGVTGTLAQGNGGTGGLAGGANSWGVHYQTDTATTGVTAAGTGTQVLHGSASAAPSWSAVNLGADVTGTLPIASGGTNSTATPTAGGVGYGTGSAHAYSSAGTAGYALVSGGSGAPTWETKDRLYRVTGSNYTNATTTPTTITGLSWSLAAGQELGFQCVLGVQNSAATSAIRYNVNGPVGATTVALQFNVHTTSATAEVITSAAAFSAAAQSTSVIASVITTLHTDFIRGTILNGGTAGTVSIQAAGSAASTSTVYRGSYCEVF